MAETTVVTPLASTHAPLAGPGAPGLRRSPAAQLADAFAAATAATAADAARAVAVREVPFLPQLGLRAVAGSAGAAALESALGVSLPSGHGNTTSGAEFTVLWIGPDEFLAVGTAGADASSSDRGPSEAARLSAALGEVGARTPGAVVDLSANRTTFELTGPSARAVLEKGVSFDLHPRHFAVGQAIATVLDHVPVLVWKTGEDAYRILPRASFADHVGRWLIDAMREFAVRELTAPGAR
ncbi:sarcosine oxidase subunit gamma family protein [Sinomonas sp. ASV486]|uniref:sarcosine oxidase subunit gamma n=1 Tax=Sinomonas sp. ASV486 TaxID=3051170 RepID=UPI0027DD08BE|nr:sarcosine oxidase subunit gamma family protein [Sinomonas sp. ASV486]MDQ4490952.1 sarcosine oxidase subunit gamma family protein [Sinomonas sp. ASV486]